MTAQTKLVTHKINEIARLNSKKRTINSRIQSNLNDIREINDLFDRSEQIHKKIVEKAR